MRKRSSFGTVLTAAAALAFPLAGLAAGAGGAAADPSSAAGVSAGEAGAAKDGATSAPSFAEADRDGDGFIDQSEAERVPNLDVAGMDTDQDGRLSRTEFEAGVQGAGVIDADVPPGSGHTDGATGEYGQSAPDPRGGEDYPNPDDPSKR